jgi:deoxycytidylate deaminase
MNQKLYSRLLEVAKALKNRTQTGAKHHSSFLVKKGKIVCIGVNNYNKQHPAHRYGEYKDSHKFTRDAYRASLHSEISLLIRSGLESWEGHELVNIRVDNNGNAAMSRCCPNCERVVNMLSPNRVFYSLDDNTYQEMELKG